MQVIIAENMLPWLQYAADKNADWKRKAIKSTANYARDLIKQGIKSEAPGGSRYAPIMNLDKSRDLMGARNVGAVHGAQTKRGKRHAARRTRTILGKLGNWIRYAYADDGSVTVGWLKDWAVIMGTRAELGYTEGVSGKMRGLYGGAAEGLKKTTTEIKIPARPTINPMYLVLMEKLPKYFEDKINEYLINGGPPAKDNWSRRVTR